MPGKVDDRAGVLQALEDAVADAAGYLATVDEDLHDGHQTAREVLCHLVFWHREYVQITRAMIDGRQPSLRRGTFARLNAEATREFAGQKMTDLADSLLELGETLLSQLRSLPDWSVPFPVKYGGRPKNVAERLPSIARHLRGHMSRLQRAARLGEAWVKAYYPDQE
ncbi:MAG: hypothetical protein JSW55_18010 [Chloroflexota bacterium]|nr:MAG: hypothetical protein JSW55_18010 [Chloroflexota bacterium]